MLSIRIKRRSREFPRKSRRSNTERREKLRPSPRRLLLPITMPLSILGNIFLNMFLRRESNTFKSPRNKLDMSISQSKDKLFTIPINLSKSKEWLLLKLYIPKEDRPKLSMLKEGKPKLFMLLKEPRILPKLSMSKEDQQVQEFKEDTLLSK